MIELTFKAQFDTPSPPFVAKVRVHSGAQSTNPSAQEALAAPAGDGTYRCRAIQGAFSLRVPPGDAIDGDVLLCVPTRKVAHRLFRRASRHNTLLLTERCDQLCLMCSQPPKHSDDDWRFPYFEQALSLCDTGTLVGISGGEPTLYLDSLIDMLSRASEKRPDLRFHVLSNAQHFSREKIARVRALHEATNTTWGIPLYSHRPATHDEIVGKPGAFERLLENIFLLGSVGAKIELRTVITALNMLDLPHLAGFVAKTIPFIGHWAIMGMEPIGYARAQWDRLFFDHSIFSQPLTNALEIAGLKGVPCHLYNVPRCTVPERYRNRCVDSISDWKKKYLPECADCGERNACSGFFEWYSEKSRWARIAPIASYGGKS
ncbi:His-Xaa-Ser system radical SAM maturase HxsC [Constrictibacter sp. MBR-5]|jgi:His-Xaa-Ser system radical SAM maturase HxsC|uniref:His-Xaa-Ser system radical SAM maturase HxsC n=1 Tax=Constrictibacter sp. MBR-5 TaxID=3156467 RepID=UPI003397B5C4